MRPTVSNKFDQMNGLQRAAESFRHVALSLEFWISPGGQVREWMKTNLKLAVLIAVPTFMVFPVVITALWELSACINALTALVSKLVALPVLALLSISIFFRILGVFRR